MVTEGTVCHVFVDENHLTVIIAISNKRDKVAMAKLRKHLDLSPELPSTLLRLRVQALDCHNHTLVDETLIHIPKTTSADNQFLVEVISRYFDLVY